MKSMAKASKMEKVMSEFSKGKLKMGKGNKKVKSKDQAVAIGLVMSKGKKK